MTATKGEQAADAASEAAYTLGRMTRTDLDEVRAFLRDRLLADGPRRQPGWLEWQYDENPDGADVRLCRRGRRLVGMSGFIPCRVAYEAASDSGAFSTNTFVLPEHRSRGVGRRIHEARLGDYDWALSSGQSSANRRLYRQLGFVERGRYRRLFVQTRRPPLAFNGRFLRRLYSWIAWTASGSRRDDRLRVRIDSRAPRVAAACYLDRFGGKALGPVWTHEHVVWRYERHPYFDYAFASVVCSEEQPLGFAVIRYTETAVELVDLYAPRADMVGVLQAVAGELPGLITGLFVGQALHHVFRRAGWTSFASENRLLAKSNDPVRERRVEGLSWCFFGGDSDSDR